MAVKVCSKFMRNVANHIRAGYTNIYCLTEEHERFSEEMSFLAEKYLAAQTKGGEKWNTYEWTITNGWKFKGKIMPRAADEPPTPFVDFMKVEKFEPFSIIIMHDMHHFLTKDAPDMIQAVRDMTKHCQKTNKCVIFANSILEFPREIEACLTVLDHELPTPEDIDASIDMICESVGRQGIKISLPPEKRYVVRESLKGMRLSDVDNALAISLVEKGDFDPNILLAEKCKAIKKTELLTYVEGGGTFDQIGGLDRAKEWIKVWMITFTEKAKKHNLAIPRGILLLGVPGCGKTELATAIARELGIAFIRFDMASVFGRYVGDSEQNMRRALRMIDAVAPCVLFIDEIEKGAAGANANNSTDGGTSPRVYGEFLKWQNDHTSPVFVVATANDIRSIPVEYLRLGRFDKIWFVDIPNRTERADIFRKQFIRQKVDSSKFDMESLLEASNQFTGAEIMTAIAHAKIFAAAQRNQSAGMDDILFQLKGIKPEAIKNKDRIQAIRARAEEVATLASYEEKADPSEVQAGGAKWRNVQV